METKLLTYNDFQLTYYVSGESIDALLCFPGYGRNATDFQPLSKRFPSRKIIAVNYFFDGIGVYPEERLEKNQLTKKEYANIISQILIEEKVKTYSTVAYSMGGRLCLCFLEFDSRVNAAIFVAPDGVIISKWHKFTNSAVVRKFYRTLVLDRPKTFFSLIKNLKRTRIISNSMMKFLDYHLRTERKRQQVYNIWLSSCKLLPQHRNIQKNSDNYFLILGKYDRIITSKVYATFKENISANVKYHELEKGHDLMTEVTFSKVADLLK